MGSCTSNNNNNKRTIIKMNQILKENNQNNQNSALDQNSQIRQKFQKEIKMNNFFTLNTSILQERLVNQFENSNTNPIYFIQNNTKFTNLFKKQFSLSYLKCEPLLNNVFTTKDKESQLLFINLSIFILSNGGAVDRKIELVNKLLLESLDDGHRRHNLGKLKEIIRNVINVCLIIIIYFSAVFIFLDDELKNRIFLMDENVIIEKKYDYSSLDSFFFDKFETVNKFMDEDVFMKIWEDFLNLPYNENNAEDKNFDGVFQQLSESVKDEIKFRLCHMLDPFVFFDVFMKSQIPNFNISHYKSLMNHG